LDKNFINFLKDYAKIMYMISQTENFNYRDHQTMMFNKMKSYLTASSCRRQIILTHFDKDDALKSDSPYKNIILPLRENCCDNCCNRLNNKNANINEEDSLKDFTLDAHKVILNGLSSIKRLSPDCLINLKKKIFKAFFRY